MSQTSLQKIFDSHHGKATDKWSSYLSLYGGLLEPEREKIRSLLEIGVQNGGSLEVWAEYFPQAEAIIGCDIDPACHQLEFDDARIQVVVADAKESATFAKIAALCPVFDLIIDDGSHTSGDIIAVITRSLPMLRDNGILIIEDLHCSYWKDFDGGLHYPYSSIAFLKRLIDIINVEHWGLAKTAAAHVKEFLEAYQIDANLDSLQSIHSIGFHNSTAIIRKRSPADNGLGRREVRGETAQVAPSILEKVAEQEAPAPQPDYADPIVEIPALKAALEESQNALEESQNEAQALRSEIAAEQARWSDEHHARKVLENELTATRSHLSDIINSRIWRYTAFIRKWGA